MKIADFLGGDVSHFLGLQPFKNWRYKVKDDAEEQTRNYIFGGHCLEIICNNFGKILTLFTERGFDDTWMDVPFTFERSQVLKFYGPPVRSGAPDVKPVLGEFVPWDLFRLPTYAVHVEYGSSQGAIQRITFMEFNQVPEPAGNEVILTFIPSLIATLKNREEEKGTPLTKAEVLSIRDSAPVVALTKEQFQKVEEERGYRDLPPENVWREYQEYCKRGASCLSHPRRGDGQEKSEGRPSVSD